MKKPSLSRRAQEFPRSALRGHIADFEAERSQGHIDDFWPLHIGQPRKLHSHDAITAACHGEEALWRYAPSQGREDLLSAAASFLHKVYGITVPTSCLQIHRGGSAGLREIAFAVADHGDDLMVIVPSYTAYKPIFLKVGVNIIAVPANFNGDFAPPTVEDLHRRRTARTRGVVLCYPCNPAGTHSAPRSSNPS